MREVGEVDDYRVPWRVFELLVGGFVRAEAHWLLGTFQHRGGYKPGDLVHPGDSIGVVLGWLWQNHPDYAISLLTDLVVQLRTLDELVDPDAPPIMLDDLLDGLPLALPQSVSDNESLAFVERARTEIPQRLDWNQA